MSASISLSSEVSEADRAAIVDGLIAFNTSRGMPWTWVALNLVLRGDDGAVIGGFIGETNAGWLFVKGLWVDERHRGQGWGSRMMEAAELEARRRGCLGVYLDTYSFQARPFYEGLGYSVFGELRDHPPGGAKYYLAKRFSEAPPAAV